MAYQDMQVQYRGSRIDNIHIWNVFEPIVGDPRYVSAPPREVTFYSADSEWTCTCGAKNQSLDTGICDHSLAVFNYIARRPGPWERDSELMQTAWRVMRRTEQEDSAKAKQDRDQAIYKALLELKFRTVPDTFAEKMKDVSESINDFSRVYSWNSRPVYVGIDPTTTDDVTAKPVKKTPKKEPEHKEPEEPKKPKSRFSEIDL